MGTSPYSTQNSKGTADEMHIVVYDKTGSITGFDVDVAGQRTKAVLETYAAVSKHPSAKTPQVIQTTTQMLSFLSQQTYIGLITQQQVQIGEQIYLQVQHLQQ